MKLGQSLVRRSSLLASVRIIDVAKGAYSQWVMAPIWVIAGLLLAHCRVSEWNALRLKKWSSNHSITHLKSWLTWLARQLTPADALWSSSATSSIKTAKCRRMKVIKLGRNCSLERSWRVTVHKISLTSLAILLLTWTRFERRARLQVLMRDPCFN